MAGAEESGFGMAARVPFWLLAALLCIVFFTGGSTWDSEPQLMLLRPAALLIAGCAFLTLRWEHIARNWVVAGLFLGAALLTAAHLVPLPYAWWSAFPGRDIIVSIDQVAGLGQISRPLSMAPDATLNALYALGIPFAVLLLRLPHAPVGTHCPQLGGRGSVSWRGAVDRGPPRATSLRLVERVSRARHHRLNRSSGGAGANQSPAFDGARCYA